MLTIVLHVVVGVKLYHIYVGILENSISINPSSSSFENLFSRKWRERFFVIGLVIVFVELLV